MTHEDDDTSLWAAIYSKPRVTVRAIAEPEESHDNCAHDDCPDHWGP